MSDIKTAPATELDATVNGTEVVEANSTAPATEVAATEAPKTVSLDDALAKAFEKHTPTDEAKPNAEPAPVASKLVDPITGRESEPMKAPAGWTPTLKEKWKDIDPTTQKFILDREKDMAQTISKTADARKLEAEFKSIIAPHEAIIRSMNVPATSVVKDVMGQWALMTTGTPQAKANIIHQLIQHFRPDIPTLIALSNGQAQGQPLVQAQPQKSVDELVQERFAAQQEEQTKSAINSDIERFAADPRNEFFDNVRESMGRIINAELVSADSMPELFKKAYDLACSQNPEISQVLSQRANPAAYAPAVRGNPPTRPVASVKPSLGAGQKTASPARKMSMDDAVAEAFRRHSA